MSKVLLNKLEKYEKIAYDGGYGSDWLEIIGESFKFYISDCVEKDCKVTIRGFEKYLDERFR